MMNCIQCQDSGEETAVTKAQTVSSGNSSSGENEEVHSVEEVTVSSGRTGDKDSEQLPGPTPVIPDGLRPP